MIVTGALVIGIMISISQNAAQSTETAFSEEFGLTGSCNGEMTLSRPVIIAGDPTNISRQVIPVEGTNVLNEIELSQIAPVQHHLQSYTVYVDGENIGILDDSQERTGSFVIRNIGQEVTGQFELIVERSNTYEVEFEAKMKLCNSN